MLMAMHLSVHHATAAELVVAPDAEHTTIQSAIDSARDGDEILIASGISHYVMLEWALPRSVR